MTKKWAWHVRGYYAPNVKPPKRPGELAIEVGGVTRESLDMDIAALKVREDIQRIELEDPYGNVSEL